MSAKNCDTHGRWRTRVVGFRVSEEENKAIDEMVSLSGYNKQDYILSKILNKDIIVKGNPRVFKALKDEMASIYDELSRLHSADDVNDRLIESINLVSKLVQELTKY